MAAAAAVAVRRSREQQAPTRHRLEEMVAASSQALQDQEVMVLKIGACHLYAPRNTDLMGKELKLKFRMHDLTHHKVAGEKTVTHKDEARHVIFGNLGTALYEGGDLEFDVCSPQRLWGRSQVVARGKTSLQDALASLKDATRAGKPGLKLDLLAAESSGKVIANLVVDFGIEVSTLRDAGGIDALKLSAVPPQPSTYSAFNFDEYNGSCMAFADQASRAQQSLEELLVTASASLPASTPIKSQRNSRRGSTVSVGSGQGQWSPPASIDGSTSGQRRYSKVSTDSSQRSSHHSSIRSSTSSTSTTASSALRRSGSRRSSGPAKVLFSDLPDEACTSSHTTTI
jgi:hypothetical protein